MTDNFALLHEPRRPWLDPDSLKQKFLALSADAHPDRSHNAGEADRVEATRRYAELNAAYHCLREPKQRLLHLFQLELGTKPKDVQQIPPALADIFIEAANLCQKVDVFLAEKSRTVSPLRQVQLFERAQEWIEPLRQLESRLARFHGQLLDELKSLDATWKPDSRNCEQTVLWDRLENLYRLFGYFNRWSSQLQERMVQLSL